MNVPEKIGEFVKSLNKDMKIALLYDTDPDGICSGVIIAKSIEQLRGKKIDFRILQKHNDVALTEETIEKLKKLKLDWLVVSDKPLDSDPSTLKEAEKYCRLLIFDHHKILADLNSEKTIFIKSQYAKPEIDGSLYPTTKLVYDLFSKYTDLSRLSWVAAIGIIGDMAQKQWHGFLDRVFEENNVDKGTNYFDTPIGKACALISISDTCDKHEDAFDVVYEAKNYDDVVNSKLKGYQAAVQKEINRILDEFNAKSEKHGELRYYEIDAPYSLNSMISTILSMRERNKTFVVLQRNGEYYNISARRQDNKIAMNEVLAKAAEGLPNASGGGHRPAAGGKFFAKDLETVKKRIIKVLG